MNDSENDPADSIDQPSDSEFVNSMLIVGLGEVLWDVFPVGAKFGGAPANFACSTAGIGSRLSKVSIVSAVGNDDLGEQAIKALQGRSVDTSALAITNYPTGRVLIQLDADRKASYEIAANTAWDNIPWSDKIAALANKCDAVCFGTLGQRSPNSRTTLQRFLFETLSDCYRILDVNFRAPFYDDGVIDQSLRLANVLKLSDEELPRLAQQYDLRGDDHHIMRQLQERFQLKCVALTLGANGAMLVRGEELCQVAGSKVDVVDTVGAGDAFTAALTLGLLQSNDLAAIAHHATMVAAYVCTQAGATPSIPNALHI